MRRALETMRMMNTDQWNRFYFTEPDFDPPSRFPEPRARYAVVKGRHEETLAALRGLTPGASPGDRAMAIGALRNIRGVLRNHEMSTDFTTGASQLMPAMMRGSDRSNLIVNRRQFSIIERAVVDFTAPDPQPQPQPAPVNPAEADMLRIITGLSFHSNRHTRFVGADGRKLSELFSNPPSVLEYLKTAKVSETAGPLAGQPLIIPGNADGSAFIGLLQTVGHPMRSSFQAIDNQTQKKRIDIVREWINGLTA